MLEKKYQVMKNLKINIFKASKPKKEYKTSREYRDRPISHDGVWLDLDCVRDRDKIITA